MQVRLAPRMRICSWRQVDTTVSLSHSHSPLIGGDRKTLISKHAELTKDLEKLRIELSAYSDQDPVELEKKATETERAHLDAEKFTDQILVMQGWINQQYFDGSGGPDFKEMLKSFYYDEYDEEEGCLREL
jgi:hypothetical protein